MNARLALGGAAAFLFAAVALGAFGAHALKTRLTPDLIAIYQTGGAVPLLARAGLLAVGILLLQKPDNRALAAAAWLLVAGLVLFCGSLYRGADRQSRAGAR